MFRPFLDLITGATRKAGWSVSDAQTRSIQRQHLRECAQAVSAARKALALAIAQHEKEAIQYQYLRDCVAAPGGDQAALAQLRTDLDMSGAALASLTRDLDHLRESVATLEDRLWALKRLNRRTVAADQPQGPTLSIPGGTSAALREAKAMLARLRSRQTRLDAANAVGGA